MSNSGRDEKFPQNGFEAWGGYMQAKISKLEEQFSSRANKEEEQISNIFNGISIYVNGYTKPSADVLKNLMLRHGGVYHTYQRNNDFIIASNLPDTKVKNQCLSKVIRPEWITESIKVNCLLDYKDYLLYHQSRTQPKLNFVKTPKTEGHNLNENYHQHDIKGSNPDKVEASVTDNTNIDMKPIIHRTDHDRELASSTNKPKDIMCTAADPNFISEFYNNSRLHHISQLGACFKQYINDLRDTNNYLFPARAELKQTIERNTKIMQNSNMKLNFQGSKIIMHIDMDCFFVSVGVRNRPELQGRPIAVTHARNGQHRPGKRPGVDRAAESNLYRQRLAKSIGKVTGRIEDCIDDSTVETRVDSVGDEDDKYGSMSEIASCSYEARAKGINNGMFMGAALKLCPDIVAIPYDFDGYKEVAYTLYNTIAQYTLDIEAVSCDEMYVDCTELIRNLGITVQEFASVLRQEIRNKTGCPCSTGFGGNRLQARLATKQAKPDGQFFLTADLVEEFMFDIKLKDLPGVGRQTSHKLEALGHETCGSLQSLSLSVLQQHLGNKTGEQLYDQCRGRDSNPLNFHSIRKSVSAEVNYGIRFENNDQCTTFLTQLSAEVFSRMNQFKVCGKCITLKLMVRAEEAPVETAKFMGHGYCNVINKSVTLGTYTNDLQVITKEVIGIMKKLQVDPKEMRGIGIQISKLNSTGKNSTIGAMNKFLCLKGKQTNQSLTNKDNYSNIKTNIKEIDKLYNNPLQKTPEKKDRALPTKQHSPILGISKSPSKRKRKNVTKLSSTSVTLMNKFLQGNNQKITDNVKKPLPHQSSGQNVKSETNIDNDISNLPWQTVRSMLRAWVDSKMPPLQCDVNFLASYMTSMVIHKRIDKVKILMSFLNRKTGEMDSKQWSDVYELMVNEVQIAMEAVYGKKLLL